MYDFDEPPPQLPSLEFKVYDSDTFSSEPLGFVVVKLEDYGRKTKAEMETFKLGAFGKMKNVSGEVS